MRTRASVVPGILALAALGGCCWTAARDDGALAVTASLPRGLISSPTGYAVRAFLYPADGVTVGYLDAGGKPVTDPAMIAYAAVTATEKPIPLDGHDYWEVQVDLRTPTSGSFTIGRIPAGVRCRLHLQLLDWTKGGAVAAEGLSSQFVAAAAAPSVVPVDLYLPAP
jgi:hypothetical protein